MDFAQQNFKNTLQPNLEGRSMCPALPQSNFACFMYFLCKK